MRSLRRRLTLGLLLLIAVVAVATFVYDGFATASGFEGFLHRETASDKRVHRDGALVAADLRGYEDGSNLARTNTRLSTRFLAPNTATRAESAADFARLTRQLQFDEAASVFTNSGRLHPSVINNSTPIIRGTQLGNQQVVKALTADGSNIADWAKYTSRSFQSPSGPFQVHFYRNSATGAVNYTYDYKVVFNGPR